MYAEDNNEVKAAYTLNMWTVSISQIVEYNDLNVLEQEYNNIIRASLKTPYTNPSKSGIIRV